jgi:hypothetical protein
MSQIFKVRLPDGTETYMNDRLLRTLEERGTEVRDCRTSQPTRKKSPESKPPGAMGGKREDSHGLKS